MTEYGPPLNAALVDHVPPAALTVALEVIVNELPSTGVAVNDRYMENHYIAQVLYLSN